MAKTYGSQMGAIAVFGELATNVYYHWFTLQSDTKSLNVIYKPPAMLSGLYLLDQLKTKPNNGCLSSN
jgi:hypothetical protein